MEEIRIKRDYAPHRHSSIRVCKECGKFYVITDKDMLYYFEKFNSFPLRCEDCRRKNRENNPIEK